MKSKKENVKDKNSFKTKMLKKKHKNIFNRLELNVNKFNLLELMLLVSISFVFGIFISNALNSNIISNGSIENTSFISVEKVYKDIVDNYYKNVDKEKLQESAIEGMMNYLSDNYSIYLNREEKETFNEELTGSYYGIGLRISFDDNHIPTILEVFENTSGEKAGLKIGDKILKVNDNDVTKMDNLSDVVNLIKGEKNKKIILTINREQKEIKKEIITEQVEIPSVAKKIYIDNNKKIGYIYINLFALNTDVQFQKALVELEKNNDGIDSLIIDVRGNIGGHLTAVTNILNLFFGKEDILYQINKKGVINKVYGNGTRTRNYPVVVLTDGNSASGSEILAAAFKELSNSQIIGTNTFGKGTVQRTINVSSGGMIKITTETWLTSKGNEINGIGISPTIEEKLSDEYIANPITENDNQLNKALEILRKN